MLISSYRNADSPTLDNQGKLVFVKPHEEQQSFETLIDYISTQEKTGDTTGEVRYAQTRISPHHTIHKPPLTYPENDNLREEYSTLFSHVDADIPWARIALTQKPEAINFWLGNSRSVTALHKDNYENIYVQIIGQKHFVLLPPLAYACVAERELPAATYVRDENGGLRIQEDEGGEDVPFATWDPDVDVESKEWRGTRYSKYADPVRVTLGEGDMLYLPALWRVNLQPFCMQHVYMILGTTKSASLVRRKVFAVQSTIGMTWSLVAAFIPCVIMLAVRRKLFLEKVEVGRIQDGIFSRKHD